MTSEIGFVDSVNQTDLDFVVDKIRKLVLQSASHEKDHFRQDFAIDLFELRIRKEIEEYITQAKGLLASFP